MKCAKTHIAFENHHIPGNKRKQISARLPYRSCEQVKWKDLNQRVSQASGWSNPVEVGQLFSSSSSSDSMKSQSEASVCVLGWGWGWGQVDSKYSNVYGTLGARNVQGNLVEEERNREPALLHNILSSRQCTWSSVGVGIEK